MKQIEDAFMLVSGNLSFMPDRFCEWKNKKLNSYMQEFDFIYDEKLKKNLAELKMCFDYQYSLFRWLQPKLTFKKHHKFVLYQIVGSIYEGIMYDYLNYKHSRLHDKVPIYFMDKHFIKNNNIGLGKLIGIYYKIELINDNWKNYLEYINHARKTVHSRTYNCPMTGHDKNKALAWDIENMKLNLNNFIEIIKRMVDNDKKEIKIEDFDFPF